MARHRILRPLSVFAAALLLAGLAQTDAWRPSGQEWPYESTGIRTLQRDGWTGQGIRILLLDTGVDAAHPALARADLELRYALNDRTAPPDDHHGHGTHMAGLLVGRSATVGDRVTGTHLMGAAPGATVLVGQVLSPSFGPDEEVYLIPHLEDALRLDIDILCLALGYGPPLSAYRRRIADLLDEAAQQGVLVVAAAGNHDAVDDPPPRGIQFPAWLAPVIAVGAIGPDRAVAPFTRQGDPVRHVEQADPRNASHLAPPDWKPEVVAPGVGVLGPWPDGGVARLDGTSAATALVCGGLALVLESQPDLRGLRTLERVERVKQGLAASAQPLDGQHVPHDLAAGHGLFRADRLAPALAASSRG